MLGPLTASCPLPDDDARLPDHDHGSLATLDLEALYREEQPRLIRLLSRRTTPDRAQDVVQQIFSRLASLGQAETRSITSPVAYLRTAASNGLRDAARREVRTAAQHPLPHDDALSATFDPVAALEARDRLVRIEAAVARLKPLTRAIFLARRLDGHSYDEIAARTGLSVRGVEKQMRVAIRQLGRHLRRDA
jgi:RNA polymerase sigma factor (sigma-70 family)